MLYYVIIILTIFIIERAGGAVMRKLKWYVLMIVLTVFMTTSTFIASVEAKEGMQPKAEDNLEVSLRKKSALEVTDDGYMRVFYDGDQVNIEYYDEEFQLTSRKTVEMELDIWGGFYAGENAYYLVEGQSNEEESYSKEVIRVIKYDVSWNRIGAAKITGNPDLFGGEVRYPFDYGCVEMTECNGNLYVVTGHQGYVDDAVGQGHQGFLMVEVDVETMTGEIVSSDFWHSFAQYIEHKDSKLYVLEQSEGSRYTKLSRYDMENLQVESIPVLEYGGDKTSVWAIECYASVDGMAISSENVLCVGSSIDQSKYDETTDDTPHNIYLTATPISDFKQETTTVKWLTDFSGGGTSFLGLKITKINDDRFMISWEVMGEEGVVNEDDTLSSSVLHYVFVDGSGNVISDEFTAAAPVSECQPIVKDSKIVYYASNANMVNFYTIDVQTGEFSKKAYRVVGENAVWNLNDSVLVISGTGAIDVDGEVHFRYPISSTKYYFSYSASDNSWHSINESVKTLIIETGITSISENAFQGFKSLEEVIIEQGLESIEKQAFYACENLNKITIPASVTSIGEDVLWTGLYWTHNNAHAVFATIYTYENSYALEYAKKNDIYYVVLHDYGEWQPYNGKQHMRVCNCGEKEYEDHCWTEWMDEKESSYKEEGIKLHECMICGGREILNIPRVEPPFSDIYYKAYYFDAVIWAYENGLLTGTSDTTFSPNDSMTRGMLVTVLYRKEGRPEVEGDIKFPDVLNSKYYAKAINWASSLNIVAGYTNGEFGPEDSITREQIAKILYRYAEYEGYDVTASTDLSGFSDASKVSAYADKYMKWAVAEGLIKGSNGYLNPKNNATRAEIAVILKRFVEKYES